jgi:preprotein translocase subunit SecE
LGVRLARAPVLEGLFMAADVKVWVAETKDYFNDLKLEMRRVTWPARKQVEATTAVVIFSVFAFAAYFAVVDSLVNKGLKAILDFFTK